MKWLFHRFMNLFNSWLRGSMRTTGALEKIALSKTISASVFFRNSAMALTWCKTSRTVLILVGDSAMLNKKKSCWCLFLYPRWMLQRKNLSTLVLLKSKGNLLSWAKLDGSLIPTGFICFGAWYTCFCSSNTGLNDFRLFW